MKNGQAAMIVAGAGLLGLVVGKLSMPNRSPTGEAATPFAGDGPRPARAPSLPAATPDTKRGQQAGDPARPPQPPPPASERKQVAIYPEDAAAGPANAKVTIAEFSDFQCPYCAKVGPTLRQIRQSYGDAVRIVFKHHPLAFHQDAMLAAQAAAEANRQGRFWDYHDQLFADNRNLKREDLEQRAQALGLDMQSFRSALDSKAHTAQIQRDVEQARTLGASGTPAFFVNGRLLSGAQPFDRFKTVIDEELAR